MGGKASGPLTSGSGPSVIASVGGLVQFPLIRASENKIGKQGIRKLAEIRNLERSLHNRSKPLFAERLASTYLGE